MPLASKEWGGQQKKKIVSRVNRFCFCRCVCFFPSVFFRVFFVFCFSFFVFRFLCLVVCPLFFVYCFRFYGHNLSLYPSLPPSLPLSLNSPASIETEGLAHGNVSLEDAEDLLVDVEKVGGGGEGGGSFYWLLIVRNQTSAFCAFFCLLLPPRLRCHPFTSTDRSSTHK